MILLEKLQEQGWYLTEEGLKKLTTINNLHPEDVNKIISLALDWDLRDIAAGALPSKPDSNCILPGRIVLQLQKMRNISAPKSNEESTTTPRFLQLELSDGVNNIAALEFERIANLNLNVPPGTKLFIKTEKLNFLNGFLILKASDIQILGGKVEALIEKWELAKQMLKYARNYRRLSGSGGPPPWIAFGKRLESQKDILPSDKNFKSLQTANEKDKNSKENSEFNASRSQAIAEAAKAGPKKLFGGGQQNILDHNVKKILEKGYSEEEAKYALKTTNNNLERALYNLKRSNNVRTRSSNDTKSAPISEGGRVRDRGGIASAKDGVAPLKPQANVSLFDFLTDKLPTPSSVQTEVVNNNTNSDRKSKESNSLKTYHTKATNAGGNRFENNMSSSFAANRATTTAISVDKQSLSSRPNTFNQKQEECNQQYTNKIGKGKERNSLNKSKNQTQNYNKMQNQIQSPNDNIILLDSDNTKRNEKLLNKEREQTHRQTNNDYQPNKRSNDYKITQRKPYQSKEINRTNQDSKNNTNNYQQKQIQKSNNFDKDLDNLANRTSKLSINRKNDLSSKAQVSRSRNQDQTTGSAKNQNPALTQKLQCESYLNNSHQKHSSQLIDTQTISSKNFQQNTKLATNSLQLVNSPQLGNGFAYDPSKIMGFQSKEANEYALNMLKSQGMTMHQLQLQQTAPTQVQQAAPIALPTPQQHPHTQINNQAISLFVAPPQHIPTQFGMISGENGSWKEGDLCLAKYWDDGNYYNAKITAISENTCVVLFLGYGNHEEVLKSDCAPITDAQHIPLNAYQANITTPISQPSPQIFQQRSNIHSGVGGVTNQRYRSERQMYIPPPKRNNN